MAPDRAVHSSLSEPMSLSIILPILILSTALYLVWLPLWMSFAACILLPGFVVVR